MSDRILIIAGLIIGVVTLYAVVTGSDGEITVSNAQVQVATAFVAGAGLAVLILTGKKPKL